MGSKIDYGPATVHSTVELFYFFSSATNEKRCSQHTCWKYAYEKYIRFLRLLLLLPPHIEFWNALNFFRYSLLLFIFHVYSWRSDASDKNNGWHNLSPGDKKPQNEKKRETNWSSFCCCFISYRVCECIVGLFNSYNRLHVFFGGKHIRMKINFDRRYIGT